MEPAEAATRRPHTAASKEPAPPPDTELPNKTLDTLLPPHRQPDKAPPPQNLYTNPQHRITFRRTHRKHEPLLLPPPLLKRFRAPEAGRSLTPHIFTPTEPGELPFTSDDIMKVVDRGHKDWWRGQLRGWTGSFVLSSFQRTVNSVFQVSSRRVMSNRYPNLSLVTARRKQKQRLWMWRDWW